MDKPKPARQTERKLILELIRQGREERRELRDLVVQASGAADARSDAVVLQVTRAREEHNVSMLRLPGKTEERVRLAMEWSTLIALMVFLFWMTAVYVNSKGDDAAKAAEAAKQILPTQFRDAGDLRADRLEAYARTTHLGSIEQIEAHADALIASQRELGP